MRKLSDIESRRNPSKSLPLIAGASRRPVVLAPAPVAPNLEIPQDVWMRPPETAAYLKSSTSTLGEPVLILGEDHYLDAIGTGAQLKVFESPLSWLQDGCDGCVFLDDAEARWTNERFAADQVALQDWWRVAS